MDRINICVYVITSQRYFGEGRTGWLCLTCLADLTCTYHDRGVGRDGGEAGDLPKLSHISWSSVVSGGLKFDVLCYVFLFCFLYYL